LYNIDAADAVGGPKLYFCSDGDRRGRFEGVFDRKFMKLSRDETPTATVFAAPHLDC
jgi:hypothetical protein